MCVINNINLEKSVLEINTINSSVLLYYTHNQKRKIYCTVKMEMKMLAVILVVLVVAVTVESYHHRHILPRKNLHINRSEFYIHSCFKVFSQFFCQI